MQMEAIRMGSTLKQKKLFTYGLYLLLCVAVFIFILAEAGGRGDLKIFLSASRDLFLHKNIYTEYYNDWYHYYYDILFALALYPLTFLPLFTAKVLWLILNVYFVYRIVKTITWWLPIQKLTLKERRLLFVLAFIFMFRFVKDTFHLSQVTIFILWLAMESLYLIAKNRKIGGALVLAISITIKLLPIVILPWLFFRKQWKAAILTVLFIPMLLILPSLFIGNSYNQFLLKERWKVLNPGNKEHVLDASERSFYSLTTLWSVLLVKDVGDNHVLPLKRNFADVSMQTLSLIINITRAIMIFFTLYFLQLFGYRSNERIKQFYEISYLLLVVPLIFPHQQFYAFLFMLPAMTYILLYFILRYISHYNLQGDHFKRNKIVFIATLTVIFLLTSSHLILGQFNAYYDHFKTLTYGVLMVVFLLAICHPGKLAFFFQKEGVNQSN
jgi:hypothetical protein